MVIYDLVCANFHTFEGWFKDSDDFKSQQKAGLISCPACDSAEVKLKPTKLAIAGKKSNQLATKTNETNKEQSEKIDSIDNAVNNQKEQTVTEPSAMHFNSTDEQINVLREFVEKNFEDVGDQFSDEIRKMQYGEKDHRGIRGNATAEEIEDLSEEGIDTYALPMNALGKNKLN